jgi:PAS domain S-box-containing protein
VVKNPSSMTKRELIARIAELERCSRSAEELERMAQALDTQREEIRAQNDELLAAHASLEQSLARYADLYDFAPVSYLSLDRNGLIEEANLTCAHFFGLQRRSLIGIPFITLVHPDDRAAFLRHMVLCRRSVEPVLTEVRTSPRGDRVPAHVEIYTRRASPLFEGGGEFFRTTIIDLTERKMMEDELRGARDGLEIRVRERTLELEREIAERRGLEAMLRAKADQLGQQDKRKDEFLAMLAHELRNPLAPILSSLELLRLVTVADERARAEAVIRRHVEHLARLVDDLLDVSRVSRGRVQLHKRPVELREIVERALESVRPFVDAAKHQLDVELPETPVHLLADPIRLVQVVANLLNNATKYTPPGGRIALSISRDGAMLVMSVRDSGIGMTPDALGHIFEPFFQADRSLDRAKGGLGLGLTLARMLVELHDGAIFARSEGLDRGSEFIVQLPILEGISAIPDAPRASDAVGRHLRILVVDDNVDAANALAELLSADGHAVRTAYDGRGALGTVREFQADVILLDIGLPDVDGYEVAREVRRQAEVQPTIVAITGYGEEDARARGKQAGFDHHLLKPVAIDALKLLLQRPEAGANLVSA